LRVRVGELGRKNEEQGVQLVKLIEEGKLKDIAIEELRNKIRALEAK